jgi:hypothetical protein
MCSREATGTVCQICKPVACRQAPTTGTRIRESMTAVGADLAANLRRCSVAVASVA